ncbi:MAG: 3-phosphoshikimate 1-carboxyvinyltransferase [Thiotrichaceae bacterium]|nr:3-phosphoshikimate 1-carboxyvinyltransferase [Thiotrichaceae bacterium]
MSKNIRYITQANGTLTGTLRVPGDKSISHRSIMLGSLAEGETKVSGFLNGEDCLATLNAFRSMGVKITEHDATSLTITGVGLHGLKPAEHDLDMGNSGTSMRLMSGLMSGQSFDVTLTGDRSLSTRPMARVILPLTQMNADISGDEGDTPPLTIKGSTQLKSIHYDLPVASAQVKSAVLLAGLYAKGETSVTEPAPTRDHTERMLRGFGYDVITEGSTMRLSGKGQLTGQMIDVPADISSAAFFMVAASIIPHADITLQHVGVNPTRTGVIDILTLMGANIRLENEREIGGEPVADIRIQSAALKGIDIPENLVPLAIDEFPVIFIAAACAKGMTTLTGAEELRVKESDRIQVMADGLVTCGIDAKSTQDGIIIQGGTLTGGEVDSHGDHRIAMSFVIAGQVAQESIVINDCANVNTSFPNFVDSASGVGLKLKIMD